MTDRADRVEIIIVDYNTPEFTRACVRSVLQHTVHPYHLKVYDNYPENHNLGDLWNMLIAHANTRYICLLNSDTTVSPGWLRDLVEVFNLHDDVGAVGPCTDCARNPQQARPISKVSFEDFGREWVLSGFCLLFPKRVWAEVQFPTDFGFYGQEVAWLLKVIARGYKQYFARHVFVHHEGSASLRKHGEYDELQERREARLKIEKLRKELGL